MSSGAGASMSGSGSSGSKPAPVIKPLLNQLQSSISGQFRRMDRTQHTLKTKLEQSVRHMHTRIWKLKSRESADDLSNWSTAEDLRTYLTAMSLLGSAGNSGGGRTLGKEKHNFFTNVAHFKESLEQARSKRKEEFLLKLKRMGIESGSKKAAFLWKQLCERDDGKEDAQPMESGGQEEKQRALGIGEEEKEDQAEAELTAEDEEQLRTVAFSDLGDSSHELHDPLSHAHSHSRSAAASSSAFNSDDGSSSTPYGVSVPGRRVGQAISAPKVFRKTAEMLEEEAEERAEMLEAAAAADAARKVEEERLRKEEEEEKAKEVARAKARAEADALVQPRSRHAALGAPAGTGATSRRASLVRTGSMSNSLIPSPLNSRRASLVGAATALRTTSAQSKRPLQILPEKSLSTSGSQLSDAQFAAEADRVMGLIFANPGLSALAAQAASQQADNAAASAAGEDSLGRELLRASSSALGGSAMHNRNRTTAAQLSKQEEIDRWNAKTPISSRSQVGGASASALAQQQQQQKPKSILALAAEKLGVDSMGSVGGERGGVRAYKPSGSAKDLTAAYLASFEARMPPVAAAYEANPANSKTPRPASASAASVAAAGGMAASAGTPRRRAGVSGNSSSSFGHSATSTMSNIHSVRSANDFKETRARRELVSLGAVSDPAELFTEVEKDSGSTLKSFEQLHATNRALAEEAKRRAEQVAAERAVEEAAEKRQAEKEAVEMHRDDAAQRDKLAQKSRARKEGNTPAKALAASASAGQLRSPTSPLRGSSTGARDYIHLSPVLSVPRWGDVTRQIDYATLVPGYTPPVAQVAPQPTPVAAPRAVQLDADGFPIAHTEGAAAGAAEAASNVTATPAKSPSPPPSAAASGTPLSPLLTPVSLQATPSPVSHAASPSFDGGLASPTQQPQRPSRSAQIRLFSAQLDDEGWEGSASARKLEIRRRRRLAAEPSPIPTGPSVFQQQKNDTLRHNYSRFVAATRDPQQMQTSIVRERDSTRLR